MAKSAIKAGRPCHIPCPPPYRHPFRFGFLNGAAHLSQHCTLLVAAARSDECVKCKLCYRRITVAKAQLLVLRSRFCWGWVGKWEKSGKSGKGSKMRIETKATDACRKLQFSFRGFFYSRLPRRQSPFFFTSHFFFLFCGRSNENPIKAPVAGGRGRGGRMVGW